MDAIEVKAKRKSAPRSVIEAMAGTPMPVVETAAPVVATPVAKIVPAGEEIPAVVDPATAPVAAPVSARVEEPAAPPAAVSATPTEDMTMDASTATIENATNDMSSKTEAMFTDMNGQAKGAMEKTSKMVEELAAFNKGNIEAMVESSKIIARGFETMGQDAAAFAKAQYEQSTAMMKTLASVKSPTEFMKVQSDMVRQSFDQMVAHSSRSTETMLKLAGEVAQPISNRVAVATDKMKLATA